MNHCPNQKTGWNQRSTNQRSRHPNVDRVNKQERKPHQRRKIQRHSPNVLRNINHIPNIRRYQGVMIRQRIRIRSIQANVRRQYEPKNSGKSNLQTSPLLNHKIVGGWKSSYRQNRQHQHRKPPIPKYKHQRQRQCAGERRKPRRNKRQRQQQNLKNMTRNQLSYLMLDGLLNSSPEVFFKAVSIGVSSILP